MSAPLLDATEVSRALVRPGSLWREVRVAGQTGSTNADLLALAGEGAAEGTVLVAEAQTAARGRMGRRWVSPPGAGLTFSVLLRPGAVPGAALGWVPLLAGVAAVSAIRAVTSVDATLKWPNDVLAGGAKLGGILAERAGGAIVLGIGINVSQRRADLPAAAATSLLLAGAAAGGAGAGPAAAAGAGLAAGAGGDAGAAGAEAAGGGAAGDAADGGLRAPLLVASLTALSDWYLAWRDQASPGDADACGLRRRYARLCATLGREVTVTLPGGEVITGLADGVDRAGRLEVRAAGKVVPVSAGDVLHVR